MYPTFIKIIAAIAVIVIVIQIIVSLIYSNKIISINKIFNQQRHTYDTLIRQIDKLQNQLSLLESISTLNQSSPSASLVPIKKVIKLDE